MTANRRFAAPASTLTLLVSLTLAAACTSSPTTTPPAEPDNDWAPGFDTDFFVSGALASAPATEPCTLSGGTRTTCQRIEITGVPANRDIGPFCPTTISAGAEDGGMWFDGRGEVYELDGAFIVNLADFYGDDRWQLYDPATGAVNVTDTQVSCEAAARPDVDPRYRNHCVECSIEYYGGGVRQTFLIPTQPVRASSPSFIRNTDIGVSLNGVVLGPPAPVQAILGAYTIAAFDDCGGHVNPFEGYHYHAATECLETVPPADGHAAMLGVAMDGVAIFATENQDGTEPTDLDGCRGHSDATRGYHYHAASAGSNMFIGCFGGEQGTALGTERP